MVMIGELTNADARSHKTLQEPQPSLGEIASAPNQSRARAVSRARGSSSIGLHGAKLQRASHGEIGGNRKLGFLSGADGTQERADWVSGSSSDRGNRDLAETKMGVLSETHLGKFGGSMEVSVSGTEMHNAGAKMVYGRAVKCSLKIQVIDETALLETDSVPKAERKRVGKVNQEFGEEKARQSRGKGKFGRKALDSNARRKNSVHKRGCLKNGGGAKRVYSRKEMENLRFVRVVEQKKMWEEVYTGLGASVGMEYNDLANARHQKQVSSFDPRRYGKNPAAGILGVATRERAYNANIFVH